MHRTCVSTLTQPWAVSGTCPPVILKECSSIVLEILQRSGPSILKYQPVPDAFSPSGYMERPHFLLDSLSHLYRTLYHLPRAAPPTVQSAMDKVSFRVVSLQLVQGRLLHQRLLVRPPTSLHKLRLIYSFDLVTGADSKISPSHLHRTSSSTQSRSSLVPTETSIPATSSGPVSQSQNSTSPLISVPASTSSTPLQCPPGYLPRASGAISFRAFDSWTMFLTVVSGFLAGGIMTL